MEELKEEQELERKIEHELLITEENHLIQKCTEILDVRDYESAFKYLCSRTKLLQKRSKRRLAFFLEEEVSMRLSSFPVEYSISFLEKYTLPWYTYLRVGSRMELLQKAPESDLNKLFESAIVRFPNEGFLFKEIVLFWRRMEHLEIAIRY